MCVWTFDSQIRLNYGGFRVGCDPFITTDSYYPYCPYCGEEVKLKNMPIHPRERFPDRKENS